MLRNSTQRNFARWKTINHFTDAQLIQNFPGTGIQTIPANFLSWKSGSFNDQGRKSRARGQSSGGCACRATADDQNVVSHHTNSSAMESATIRPFAVNRTRAFPSSMYPSCRRASSSLVQAFHLQIQKLRSQYATRTRSLSAFRIWSLMCSLKLIGSIPERSCSMYRLVSGVFCHRLSPIVEKALGPKPR